MRFRSPACFEKTTLQKEEMKRNGEVKEFGHWDHTLFRGVPVSKLLSWSTLRLSHSQLYTLSTPVSLDHLQTFVSHSWASSSISKHIALCLHFD